jgi:NADPH-dependent curcumin reductase CurA
MEGTNRQLRLARRPDALVDDSTFELVEEPLPALADGEYLVRNVYLSVDPTQRVWIREEESYLPPVEIGAVMRSGAIGEVVESRNDAYPVGAVVTGLLGWQEYAPCGGPDGMGGSVIPAGLPLRQMMGVLGATGITAYFGLLEIGRPRPGETVVVSGAAGATGSIAAQIAKIEGARVIGIAGSDEKCAWLTEECGLDAVIHYKTEDVAARLDELCPDGIDVFFDNVGGEILDAVLLQINIGARIVMCGAISEYNRAESPGLKNYKELIMQRGRMEGFIILDYLDRFIEAIMELVPWVAAGRIKYAVEVVDGLEHAPDALNRLFSGDHTGKLIVRVAETAH